VTILGSPLRRAAAAAFVVLLLGSAAACSSSDSSSTADSGPSSGQVNADINGAEATDTIPQGAELVTFTVSDPAQLNATAKALEDRVKALGLKDVVVQVKGDKIVADVPDGVSKDDVSSLADSHALLFRPALQTFPGGPNDSLNDPKCDAPDATPDAQCLTVDKDDQNTTVLLGPATVDGTVVEKAVVSKATATDTGSDSGASDANSTAGTYQVAVTAKADKKDDLNVVANQCNTGAASCPAADGGFGRLAVVLDGTVLVIPTVNTKDIADDALVLTGGFTKAKADQLAKQIRLASVPLPTSVTAS
jgi:preprotein translocase subunit SecD